MSEFEPYVEHRRGPGRPPANREKATNNYSIKWDDEEKELMDSMIEQAQEQDLALEAVFAVIAEKLCALPLNVERDVIRSPKAVEVRYHRNRSMAAKENEEPSDLGDFLSRLKSKIKDDTNYKQKYEDLKAEYDVMKSEHDKVMKEINAIRRYLGE